MSRAARCSSLAAVVTFAIASLGAGAVASAESPCGQKNLVELGIYGGALFPSDDHELYDFPNVRQQPFKDVAVDVGLRVSYLPWSWLGIEAEAGAMPTSTKSGETANLYHARAQLIAQYPWIVTPFIVAGGGLMGVESSSTAVGDNIDPVGHWGGGVKYYVNPRFVVRLEGRHDITKGYGPDRVAHHAEVLAGASFVLGWEGEEPADTDGDGLTDDRDRCPTEAATTPDGCPPADTDGDGVTDDQDKCPREAAATPDGCPVRDSDGDGIADDKDKCPQQAASTPDGCPLPDADGDGVPDEKDKCPQQPAQTEDGCPPDADKDGIPDATDSCPNEPETANGYKDNDGCPDELPKQVKRFTGAIRGITFAIGSAKIVPASYSTLNAAAKVLTDYPDLRLVIRGHTDITGSRERNLELSRLRAEAVKTYLVGRGIADGRLAVEGLGPDEPVASNDNPMGRAKNRRIEFKLVTGAAPAAQ